MTKRKFALDTGPGQWQPVPSLLWIAAVCPINILLLRDVLPEYVTWLTALSFGVLLAAGLGLAVRNMGSSGRKPRIDFMSHVPAYAVFLLLAWGVALAATYGQVTFSVLARDLVLTTLILGIFLCAIFAKADRGSITACACDMLIVIVLLSTVLYLMGVEARSSEWSHAGYADMLSRYGVMMMRTSFPLTRGATHHAALCSVVAIICIIYLRFGKGLPAYRHALYAIALPVAVFGIFASDGRSALAAAILSLMTYAFAKPFIRFLPLVLVVGVPVYFLTVSILPDFMLASMSRSGWASEIASGNSRAIVWDNVLKQISLDPLNFIFGYGSYGQVTSGISKNYSYIFNNFSIDPNYASVHNAGIQYFVNLGVVGLFIILFFHMALFKRICDFEKIGEQLWAKVSLCSLTCLVLNGIMDTFGTPIWEDSFLFLMLLGVAALQKPYPTPLEGFRNAFSARQPPPYRADPKLTTSKAA